MIIQLLSSIISMVLIYYTARYGFNIESLWFDITLFLVNIIIGLGISNHYYQYSKKGFNYKLWSLVIIVLTVILTIYPLDLPFFR